MVYAFSLSESYIPPQTDTDIRETTVGSLLRAIAAEHPDAPALTEIDMAGEAQRRWSYADLLQNAERLAHAPVRMDHSTHKKMLRGKLKPEARIDLHGMTLAQAIRSATIEAAKVIALEGDVGSLAPGKFADIIAVKGNPLADVAVLEHVDHVMKGGAIAK